MSDTNDPLGFATVFRHELAANADRRRFQRIEALMQLGADGDYSGLVRQRAVDAAYQESLLAAQAVAGVEHLPTWISEFLSDGGGVNVLKIRDTFRYLLKQPKELPADSGIKEHAADSDSPGGSSLIRSQLLKSATEALDSFCEDKEPDEIDSPSVARVLEARLLQALVVRDRQPLTAEQESQVAAPEKFEELVRAIERAKGARQKAKDLRDQVLSEADKIKRAGACNNAAEAATKALATAQLFDTEDQLLDSYQVFASTAAATIDILGAWRAVKAVRPSASSAGETASDGIETELRAKIFEAAEEMAAVFAAVALDCLDAYCIDSRTEKAGKAVRDVRIAAMEHLPLTPEQRHQDLLQAECQSLKELTERTVQAVKNAVNGLPDRSKTPEKGELDGEGQSVTISTSPGEYVAERGTSAQIPEPTNCSKRLHKVDSLCQRCYFIAHLLLLSKEDPDGELRVAAGMERPELDAKRAKKILSAQVKALGESASKIARWAWTAETHAAEAVHAATAILDAWHRRNPAATTAASGVNPPARPEPDIAHLRTLALDRSLVGLAFSGGGIRSATFGLGVLQALGHLRLLRHVDYLSTVSGGGYIGSWLAGWIQREQSLVNVEKQLDPNRILQASATRVIKGSEDRPSFPPNPGYPLRDGAIDDEPEPVKHLRAYSRYLAPRLFSADTWTLGTIYVRNLVVNLVSLAPWVFTLLLVSHMVVWLFTKNSAAVVGLIQGAVVFFFLSSVGALYWWAYVQRARLREAATNSLKYPEGADRMPPREGVVRISVLILGTAAGLWLFSYSPPNEKNVERLRQSEIIQRQGIAGVTAIGLLAAPGGQGPFLSAGVLDTGTASSLSLRHPGYEWLNRKSPMRDWPAFVKFSIAGMLVFVIAREVCRRLVPKENLEKFFDASLWENASMGFWLGLFAYLALELVIWPAGTDSIAVVTFGFPSLLIAVVLADYFEMVFVGSSLDESEREWHSRVSAYLVIIAAGWLVFFCTTLYLPAAYQELTTDPAYRASIVASAAGVWAALSGLGAWAGHWLQSRSASSRSIPWLKILTFLGPPVFLTGFLAFGAMLTFLALAAVLSFRVSPIESSNYLDIACNSSAAAFRIILAGIVLGAACILFVSEGFDEFRWKGIDVNLFSLHMMYANRLIRCYLGASRRKQSWRRRAGGPVQDPKGRPRWIWNPGTRGAPTNADIPDAPGGEQFIARREPTFTDFDPADDLQLRQLGLVAPVLDDPDGLPVKADKGYRGPYPLINTALNLVASADLAIQDRRAASFVLTPDFCGSPTCGYARNLGKQLTLGRAMTISGAAIDPNMGVNHSPQLTALMTITNTRLGWWLQNPKTWGQRWIGAGPGARPLILWELFGQTSESSDYVHLSDGGHFENLGVYELIRRRCRYIIVTDVTEDSNAATVNLANLIRLVRSDFGIGIQMDTEQLAEGSDARTTWHCAVGLIHYEDIDACAAAGILVYLYSSLTGDEPPDVLQYARANPAFPHETTLNQFFSEAQFESYRALGYHIATEVLGAAASPMNRDCCDPKTAQQEVRKFFSAVRKRWFPAPPGAEHQFLPTANLFLGIERHLAGAQLQSLRQELYPEVQEGRPTPSPTAGPAGSPAALAGSPTAGAELNMVNEMLQVMEMVWFAMKLDAYHAHSLNRGWMNLFRRWTSSPTFHRHWPFLRGAFSQDFVQFCERALNMTATDIVRQRMDASALRGWLAEVEEMDVEFEREWAAERDVLRWLTTGRYLSEAAALACKFQRDNPSLPCPLVWRVAMRDNLGTVMKRSCGVVCVWPPFLDAGTDSEILIWLRGPYRNLGIGKVCLTKILEEIDQSLGELARPNGEHRRLVTYYPNSRVDRADRLDRAQWMNFFFDHGFRSVPAGDQSAVPGVITLARQVEWRSATAT
jgi:hypothetical protein